MSDRDTVRAVLADDTDGIRDLVRRVLDADPRFRVVAEARDGREAIAAVHRTEPDLVMLDLAMPVMDGLEAAQRIRRDHPTVCIAALTGFREDQMGARARAAGFDVFIEKGGALDALAETLAHACGDPKADGDRPIPAGDRETDRRIDTPLSAAWLPDAASPQDLRAELEHERGSVRRLRSANEAKSVILAAVSHDLRTPLTVIQGIAQTLINAGGSIEPDETVDLLRRVVANAQRMDEMLRDLMDAERLGQGAIEVNADPLDVAEVIDRIVRSRDASERGRIVVADGSRWMLADEGLLGRVLDNLIGNALRHTPAGARVWVRTADGGRLAYLVVEDEGPGIPPDKREQIFEPFTRLRPGDSGNGLGLSVVARFVALMGGRVEVGDRRGGGASFVVTLPAAAVSASDRRAADPGP